MAISSGTKKLINEATFSIHQSSGGRGLCILVQGGYVLTAAHCLEWDCSARMAFGHSPLITISSGERSYQVRAVAVEPVSDIAVLANPEEDIPEWEVFEEFVASMTPVKLQHRVPPPRQPFPVWIRTHLKNWVSGTATYGGGGAYLKLETPCEICNGTSGGPIVNSEGELVGIVSHGENKPVKGCYGSTAPLAALALPAWLLRQIAGES
jgi:S1-C subfamily serine protease